MSAKRAREDDQFSQRASEHVETLTSSKGLETQQICSQLTKAIKSDENLHEVTIHHNGAPSLALEENPSSPKLPEVSEQAVVEINADNLQEDDEPTSEKDKELVRYYSVNADVMIEYHKSGAFLDRTGRDCRWGRVVEVDPSGWVTLQTGKSKKSLARFHAASLEPFLSCGEELCHPETLELHSIIPEKTRSPLRLSNPWIFFIRSWRSSPPPDHYQDLRGWKRLVPLSFEDEVDDYTGFKAHLDALPDPYGNETL